MYCHHVESNCRLVIDDQHLKPGQVDLPELCSFCRQHVIPLIEQFAPGKYVEPHLAYVRTSVNKAQHWHRYQRLYNHIMSLFPMSHASAGLREINFGAVMFQLTPTRLRTTMDPGLL